MKLEIFSKDFPNSQIS